MLYVQYVFCVDSLIDELRTGFKNVFFTVSFFKGRNSPNYTLRGYLCIGVTLQQLRLSKWRVYEKHAGMGYVPLHMILYAVCEELLVVPNHVGGREGFKMHIVI